jgi:predicted glycogen debranching enzyme
VIAFGPDICRDFGAATGKEWLETNGIGGFASSTIIGANTRRYHALLVAALRPPTHRTVLLSKLEETLAVRDVEWDLSCNQYPGVIHPQGHLHQREFRLDPFPTFVYEIGSSTPTRIEKTVAMCHGLNAVIVRYRLMSSPGTASLIVRPLVNCRDYHHLMGENPQFDTGVDLLGARDLVRMRPYFGGPVLSIRFAHAYFEHWGDWYLNFEYPREAERGLDFREDIYSPGYFACSLEQGESRYLVASSDPLDDLDPAELLEEERTRRSGLLSGWESQPEEVRTLVSAADAFIVERRGSPETGKSHGIVAGYPWFEEWGRDAMISLPGLTLATRRYDVARSILRTFAGHCSEGMIPNRIPNAAERPDYNTVDATLWMFWAARKYLDYTGDRDFLDSELIPALAEIISWHVRGTRYGIKADDDGLLRAGEPGTQLTWMDAKLGDWVVTPRHGKAVEVNALWHHALRFLEEMGVEHAGPSAAAVAASFRARFWNAGAGYLNDVVDGDFPEDSSLRPNQIIAVSLPYPLLPAEHERRVVEVVRADLLTPYGLRTLSPHDPRYQGCYSGDQRSRDGAYHQGTVWPWLMGPFITAHLKVSEDKRAARQQARSWLELLWGHLRDAGLGQVSEVFDGDPPYRPGGCIAQAWSVAELLRVEIEDLSRGM